MKKIIPLTVVLILLSAPLKSFAGAGFFEGITFLGRVLYESYKSGNGNGNEQEKVAINSTKAESLAKQWAVERVRLIHKSEISFGPKFNEMVINSTGLIITYNGTLNNQPTLISVGFKKEIDTLYYNYIVWDNYEEYKDKASTREKMISRFKRYNFDFGPIDPEEKTSSAPNYSSGNP